MRRKPEIEKLEVHALLHYIRSTEEVGHGHVRHARLYGAAYVSVFSQSVAGNLKVTLLFSSF